MTDLTASRLAPCTVCNASISKKAKTCPHCGQRKPFKSGPTKVPRPIAWLLILFMVLSGVTQIFDTPASRRARNSDLSDPVKQQMWILDSQDGVRERLKDPNSAQFKDSYFKIWQGTPVVCGWVNSKNALGGYGGFQRFVAAGESVAYIEEEVADFDKVWKEMCAK